MDPSNVKEDPITVIVMGGEGSGKSTFISNILEKDIGISHAMSNNEGVKDHPTSFERKGVVLREVPDLASLNTSELYRLKKSLDNAIAKVSVIYLYRVNERRITVTMKEESRKLCILCKDAPPSRIVFVSTQRDEGSRPIDGKIRDDAVTEFLCGPFIRKGANADELAPKFSNRPFRNNTIDPEDAMRILRKALEAKESERPLNMGLVHVMIHEEKRFETVSSSDGTSNEPKDGVAVKQPQGIKDELRFFIKPEPAQLNSHNKNIASMEKSNVKEESVTVLVMGSGKSTFISNILGDDIGISHAMSNNEGVKDHPTSFERKKVVLREVPDLASLKHSELYGLKKLLDNPTAEVSVVYLYKVNEERVTATMVEGIKKLCTLCSRLPFSRITFVSTQKDEDSRPIDGKIHEDAITESLCGSVIRKGAHVDKLELKPSDRPFNDNPIDPEDAKRILRNVMEMTERSLTHASSRERVPEGEKRPDPGRSSDSTSDRTKANIGKIIEKTKSIMPLNKPPTKVEAGMPKNQRGLPKNLQTSQDAPNGTGDSLVTTSASKIKRQPTNTSSPNIPAERLNQPLPKTPQISDGTRKGRTDETIATETTKKNVPPSSTAPKFDTRKRIILMGTTGAGKSTFISNILGRDIGIGHKSHIKEYEIKDGDETVFLVDTPGFGDMRIPDIVILKRISDWLKRKTVRDSAIVGVIYLHNIGDIRMPGATKRNLQTFRSLCGDDYSPQTHIVTTHWSYEGTIRHDRELQESIFKETWWKELIHKGAHTDRLEFSSSNHPFPGNNINPNDAQRILGTVLNEPLMDVSAVEQKKVHQTTAGNPFGDYISNRIAALGKEKEHWKRQKGDVAAKHLQRIKDEVRCLKFSRAKLQGSLIGRLRYRM